MGSDSKNVPLDELLRHDAELREGATPVERLAYGLGSLSRGDTGDLEEVLALLGDGLSAPVLYHAAPETVLPYLANALPSLDAEQRFALVAASLAMRPLRDEDVARYAAICLDAIGRTEDAEESVPPPDDVDAKLVLYRWARLFVRTSVHVATALEALLEARHFPASGGTPFETFTEWLDVRAVYIVTPRQSPAVRHHLTEAQREDWMDQPWMLGTPESTFTLEEVEEDSSEVNMRDGELVTEWLRAQVLPGGDFFAEAYGWLPRTTLDEALREAEARGITVLEPNAHDLEPRAVAEDDMTIDARRSWGEAVRALAAIEEGEIATDVALVFFHDTEGQRGAFELGVSNTLKNDGAKNTIRFYFDHAPESIVTALRKTGARLDPLGLPEVLSAVFPYAARTVVRTPAGLYFDVGPEHVEAWGYPPPSAEVPPAAEPKAIVVPDFGSTVLVGHLSIDADEELEPFRVTLVPPGEDDARAVHAELVLQGSTYAVEVLADGDRVTFRQREQRPPLTFEGAWDTAKKQLRGLWRMHHMGGTFTLAPEEGAIEDVSAEELYESARRGSLSLSTRALEALRFPGELEHLRALVGDAHFRVAYQRSIRDRAMRTTSRRLDAQMGVNATELHPALMPEPFRALAHVVEKLGYGGEVRLWVHNADNVNAFVTEDGGVVIVHFTSGLLESFDEAEVRIVIAHELGHVLFGHHELALRVQGTDMAGATQARYFALRRHQELTTDRVAMFVCDEPDRMFLVQAMLTTGVRKRSLFGSTEGIVEHARAEVEQLRKRWQSDRKLDTHPYASLRTVALDSFARSGLAAAVHAGEVTTAPDPNDETKDISRFLDVPLVEEAGGDVDRSRRVFLALAALHLAEADGSTSAREVRNVVALEPDLRDVVFETLGYGHGRRFVTLLGEARVLRRRLSVPEREALLLMLLGVVKSDNVIAYSESSRFVDLGGLLGVDTLSFQKLVDKLYKASR